jgi:hypothetical protein
MSCDIPPQGIMPPEVDEAHPGKQRVSWPLL